MVPSGKVVKAIVYCVQLVSGAGIWLYIHVCVVYHVCCLCCSSQTSLRQIQKAIKGFVVMSEQLEKVYTSFLNNQVQNTHEIRTYIVRMINGVQGSIAVYPLISDLLTAVHLTFSPRPQQVPAMWARAAYPSLKPLSAWVKDLVYRIHFIEVSVAGPMAPVCLLSDLG